MIRESFVALVKRKFKAEVVLEASNGVELLNGLNHVEPDIILMDIDMPEMDGVDTTKEVKSKYPAIKILILSSYDDESLILKMIHYKANGYILKDDGSEELVRAVTSILQNGHYFNAHASLAMYNKITNQEKSDQFPDQFIQLDDVDKNILRLLCQEFTSKEIADRLCMSKRTVDARKDHMMKAIGAKNSIGLTVYAIKKKIYKLG